MPVSPTSIHPTSVLPSDRVCTSGAAARPRRSPRETGPRPIDPTLAKGCAANRGGASGRPRPTLLHPRNPLEKAGDRTRVLPRTSPPERAAPTGLADGFGRESRPTPARASGPAPGTHPNEWIPRSSSRRIRHTRRAEIALNLRLLRAVYGISTSLSRSAGSSWGSSRGRGRGPIDWPLGHSSLKNRAPPRAGRYT